MCLHPTRPELPVSRDAITVLEAPSHRMHTWTRDLSVQHLYEATHFYCPASIDDAPVNTPFRAPHAVYEYRWPAPLTTRARHGVSAAVVEGCFSLSIRPAGHGGCGRCVRSPVWARAAARFTFSAIPPRVYPPTTDGVFMSSASSLAELAITTLPRGDVLAQTTDVNTTGVRTWIEDNIVFTILVLIACVVLMGGLRGNLSKVVTVGGLSLVGMAYLGIATNTNAATGIGNWLLGLVGIQV